uniref:Uncharacterized protein n=1 Tax=Rhizophora mucronata TaxID=61149 RepID=A0A2P2JR19_RHIMU
MVITIHKKKNAAKKFKHIIAKLFYIIKMSFSEVQRKPKEQIYTTSCQFLHRLGLTSKVPVVQ